MVVRRMSSLCVPANPERLGRVWSVRVGQTFRDVVRYLNRYQRARRDPSCIAEAGEPRRLQAERLCEACVQSLALLSRGRRGRDGVVRPKEIVRVVASLHGL
jgi:hypothetical protein